MFQKSLVKKLTDSGFAVSLIVLLTFICVNFWLTLTEHQFVSLASSHPEVKHEFAYLIDDTSELTVEQALQNSQQFTYAPSSEVPYDLNNHPVWLKVFIENKQMKPLDIVIFADNAMLSAFESYDISPSLSNAQMFEVSKTLDQYTFPHIKLSVDSKQQRVVLLKVQAQGPPNIPIVLYESSKFEDKLLITQMLYGAFIGIVLMIALYNLVLYFAIKDKVYLIYVAYLFSALMVLSSVNGFGYYIQSVSLQQLLNEYTIFFHYTLVTALLAFTLFFLRYDKDKPIGYWLGLSFVAAFIIMAFASQILSHELQVKLFFGLEPLFFLLALYLVFSRYKSSFAWSRFYFFSWIPLLIGSAIQPLVLLNLLEYSFFTRNAFLFGVLIEIMFMSLALAERMRRFEFERIAAVSYHPKTHLPRKVVLEKKITEMTEAVSSRFYVIAIKPELIDKIGLYVDERKVTQLYRAIEKKLSPLFSYNDAIVSLTEKDEKIGIVSGKHLVLILDCHKLHQSIDVIVHSILQLISEAYEVGKLKLPLKGVVGISKYPEHGINALSLLNQAMLAVEQAEHNRKSWCFYQASEYQHADEDLSIAIDINQALDSDGLTLFHQPQVDLSTKRVCGSEVLLRWQHPDYLDIAPERIIAVAENFGLINKLSLWVIEQALIHQLRLKEHGYNHHISVNISSQDVVSEVFFDAVVQLLESYDVTPGKLVLELSESSSLINNDVAMGVISKLAGIGVTISLDDYGTASSSVAYISDLPFKELKVDERFIEDIYEDSHRHIIVKSAVMLAKGLGLEVVAEGISNQKDEDTLRSFGCDLGQGYFYAEPMSFDDYSDWLRSEVGGHSPPPLTGEFISKHE